MAYIVALLSIWIPIITISYLIIKACITGINKNYYPESKITFVIIICLVMLISCTLISITIDMPLNTAPIIVFTAEILIGWCLISALIKSFRHSYNNSERDEIAIVLYMVAVTVITLLIIKFTYDFFKISDLMY